MLGMSGRSYSYRIVCNFCVCLSLFVRLSKMYCVLNCFVVKNIARVMNSVAIVTTKLVETNTLLHLGVTHTVLTCVSCVEPDWLEAFWHQTCLMISHVTGDITKALLLFDWHVERFLVPMCAEMPWTSNPTPSILLLHRGGIRTPCR